MLHHTLLSLDAAEEAALAQRKILADFYCHMVAARAEALAAVRSIRMA